MEIYLYGVIEETQEKNFGKIGIKEQEVYSIGNSEFQGIVQNVNGDFKELKDLKIMEELLFKHEEVLREIQKNYETILPTSFGTILKGEAELKNWLIE
ncbi:MAG: GvpL/GvpF family gas vesicle protein, partial [Armatimonadetes bacterium]|nr:GvpL/GvpF family gas vesicle protein [Armatimonadota bacterium]